MSRNHFSEYGVHHTALEFQGCANTILNGNYGRVRLVYLRRVFSHSSNLRALRDAVVFGYGRRGRGVVGV